ncbi:hypothetical protein FKB36_02640 [Methanoculleus sp. Afa-1]|uniref:EfeO-type cupredoxin-like domain-containing protein n=2 Tax=Methanoculleus formosensis TaxID=2590886 RepID=A0A9E5DEB7_9EURY|nr:hypothetical protein [Methanoculleus sp. Afa-1]
MIAGCVQPAGNETVTPGVTPGLTETPMGTTEETPAITETPMETETPMTTATTPMETETTPVGTETPMTTATTLAGGETPMATATTPVTGATETPPGPPAALVADETVSITDSGYVPNTLTVPVGTTVGWTNDGSTNQTVSANGEAGFFDSGLLAPGDTFSYTFNGVGNYTYQSMTGGFEGEIIVTA